MEPQLPQGFVPDAPAAPLPQGFVPDPPSVRTPPSAGRWEDRGVAGMVWHPADGGSDRTRVDNSVGGLPPEMAALSTLAVGRAVAAPALSAAGRAAAGATAVVTQAAPIVKYELTKTALEKIGIPTPLAMVGAMMVSGYRKGAKGEVAAPASDVPPPGVDRYKPNVSGYQPPAETPPPIAAAAEPVAPAPVATAAEPAIATRPANALPDQKALNEAALAERRAAYQARQASTAAAATPKQTAELFAAMKPAKIVLTAEEFKAGQQLMANGMTADQVLAAVAAQRTFLKTFNTPTTRDVGAAVQERNVSGHWK